MREGGLLPDRVGTKSVNKRAAARRSGAGIALGEAADSRAKVSSLFRFRVFPQSLGWFERGNRGLSQALVFRCRSRVVRQTRSKGIPIRCAEIPVARKTEITPALIVREDHQQIRPSLLLGATPVVPQKNRCDKGKIQTEMPEAPLSIFICHFRGRRKIRQPGNAHSIFVQVAKQSLV